MDLPIAGEPAAAAPRSNLGAPILDLLRDGTVGIRTAVYLRHSIRNSLAGIPAHQQLAAEITPEGALRAREFGEALQRLVPGRRLVLGHTIARRSRMTASCIGAGYAPDGHYRMIDYRRDIDDLILDPDAFLALRDAIGWEPLLRRWLGRGVPRDIMRDPHVYADTHLEQLIAVDGGDDRDLFVVIGDDITLFALVSRLFGRTITTVDFLNGIAITTDGTTSEARFSGGEETLATTLKSARLREISSSRQCAGPADGGGGRPPAREPHADRYREPGPGPGEEPRDGLSGQRLAAGSERVCREAANVASRAHTRSVRPPDRRGDCRRCRGVRPVRRSARTSSPRVPPGARIDRTL